MPIYKYHCQRCDNDFEIYKSKIFEFYQKIAGRNKHIQCPRCKAESVLIVGNVGLKEAIACGKTDGGFG